MRAVRLMLGDELVKEVDRAAKRLRTSRSAFARQALRAALGRLAAQEQEEAHRRGYQRHPVRKGEFSIWETEHRWGDE